MRKNLFYAMIAVAFLMVGCGSGTDAGAAATTGDSLTGKAGGVSSSTPVEVIKAPLTANAGSDAGR